MSVAREILAALETASLSIEGLMQATGRPKGSILTALERMRRAGEVEQGGTLHNAGRPHKLWRRPTPGPLCLVDRWITGALFRRAA